MHTDVGFHEMARMLLEILNRTHDWMNPSFALIKFRSERQTTFLVELELEPADSRAKFLRNFASLLATY